MQGCEGTEHKYIESSSSTKSPGAYQDLHVEKFLFACTHSSRDCLQYCEKQCTSERPLY
jgi:hypothetical protein